MSSRAPTRRIAQRAWRIANDLQLRIIDGEFAHGERLPPELDLAASYDVSRGTVRRALAVLEADGLASSRQGAGWMVRLPQRTQSFERLRSFGQWAAARGLEPGGRVVASQRRRPTAWQRARLGLGDRDAVLVVTRARTLAGAVVMLERTVYPEWIAAKIESLPDDEPSVVHALETRLGVFTDHAHHVLDAVAASSEDATLLPVRRGSPLLRVLRESRTHDGRVIELDDDRYVPGAVGFEVTAWATGTTVQRTTDVR